jgi:hypothetical protein
MIENISHKPTANIMFNVSCYKKKTHTQKARSISTKKGRNGDFLMYPLLFNIALKVLATIRCYQQ